MPDLNACSAFERQFDFKQYRVIKQKIRQASHIRLYEGLPHQVIQASLLKQELQRKQTLQLHGFSFYRELLNLSKEDADRLIELLSDEKTIQPHRGVERQSDGSLMVAGRACGGFHPDYCIEWVAGGERINHRFALVAVRSDAMALRFCYGVTLTDHRCEVYLANTGITDLLNNNNQTLA